VLPTLARVVARWPSLRALLELATSFGGYCGTARDFPLLRALGSGRPIARPSWTSRLLRRHDPVRAALELASLTTLGLATRHRRAALTSGLLSWGCHRSPLHRHGCWMSTPGGIVAPKSSLATVLERTRRAARIAFGLKLPHSKLVPPVSFLPTSAVCSTLHFSGLLHPETDHGVRHVAGAAGSAGGLTRRARACARALPAPARSP
jgi:hypothetical protein